MLYPLQIINPFVLEKLNIHSFYTYKDTGNSQKIKEILLHKTYKNIT